MTIACHYAIVRFMPFIETGEFANAGVVLFAPKARYFGFRLLGNRYARVTAFFDQLDGQVFRVAIRQFRDELQRIDGLMKGLGTDRRFRSLDRDGAFALWQEVIKPRETMLRFSEPRVVLAETPKQQLAALYAYYVERNFVSREYQEKAMDRAVRGWLREARLGERFVPGRVGNDEYHANFPFIAFDDGQPTRVIKPLNLRHPDTARIIDHGGQWVVRLNALRKRDLMPREVLFTVEGAHDRSPQGRACEEVIGDLEAAGAVVTPWADRKALIEFAGR